jgi:hypothetical protein
MSCIVMPCMEESGNACGMEGGFRSALPGPIPLRSVGINGKNVGSNVG